MVYLSKENQPGGIIVGEGKKVKSDLYKRSPGESQVEIEKSLGSLQTGGGIGTGRKRR